MLWPDGFSFGPDGLYFTNSALHLKLAHGADRAAIAAHGPFRILRLGTAALREAFGANYTLPPAGQ